MGYSTYLIPLDLDCLTEVVLCQVIAIAEKARRKKGGYKPRYFANVCTGLRKGGLQAVLYSSVNTTVSPGWYCSLYHRLNSVSKMLFCTEVAYFNLLLDFVRKYQISILLGNKTCELCLLQTGECVKIYQGHHQAVNCVEVCRMFW